MNLRLPIEGENVVLVPFTREMWHRFWMDFKRDREVSREPYHYDPVFTDRMFDIRMSQKDRKHFAICRGEKIVGEIHLEGIDYNWKKACFGIEMINGRARNKGYGTEAIGLLIGFSFDKLGLNILATTSLASDGKYCHILEKKGFICLNERDGCRYYLLGKTDQTVE